MKPLRVSALPAWKSDELLLTLANDWLLFRRHCHGTLPAAMVARLDQLEQLSRGEPRRCFCVAGRDSGGRFHERTCGAYHQ